MNKKPYFENQDDTDDETYGWLGGHYNGTEKAHMGKLPRKRGRRSDEFESRRLARKAKRDWSHIN